MLAEELIAREVVSGERLAEIAAHAGDGVGGTPIEAPATDGTAAAAGVARG